MERSKIKKSMKKPISEKTIGLKGKRKEPESNQEQDTMFYGESKGTPIEQNLDNNNIVSDSVNGDSPASYNEHQRSRSKTLSTKSPKLKPKSQIETTTTDDIKQSPRKRMQRTATEHSMKNNKTATLQSYQPSFEISPMSQEFAFHTLQPLVIEPKTRKLKNSQMKNTQTRDLDTQETDHQARTLNHTQHTSIEKERPNTPQNSETEQMQMRSKSSKEELADPSRELSPKQSKFKKSNSLQEMQAKEKKNVKRLAANNLSQSDDVHSKSNVSKMSSIRNIGAHESWLDSQDPFLYALAIVGKQQK